MKELAKELVEVLSSIKTTTKVGDYAELPSLVEKWQTLANRMEAALSDSSDIREMQEERSKLKKELKELWKEKEELEEEE